MNKMAGSATSNASVATTFPWLLHGAGGGGLFVEDDKGNAMMLLCVDQFRIPFESAKDEAITEFGAALVALDRGPEMGAA